MWGCGGAVPKNPSLLVSGAEAGQAAAAGPAVWNQWHQSENGGHDIHIAHMLLSYAAVPPSIAFLSLWFRPPHIAGEQTEAEC